MSAKATSGQKKNHLIFYLISSILMLLLSWTIAVVDPLERVIESQLQLKEGTFIYRLWQKPPLDVYLKVYIFNVSNGNAFLSGEDKKLKLTEIGPYVYQEFLINENSTFNDNGTLTFVPKRRLKFVREKSVGDPEADIILVPNLVLLAASSVAAKHSTFSALALSTLVKSLNAKPFINLTVYDYMWGYDDNLVRLANNILPNFINFDKLGYLDRLLDEGLNLVSMMLPKGIEKINTHQRIKAIEETSTTEIPIFKDTSNEVPTTPKAQLLQVSDVEYEEEYDNFIEMETFAQTKSESDLIKEYLPIREYSIDSWNGSPGLLKWGFNESSKDNSVCNTLQGSFDGTLFPRSFSKTDSFVVYRKAFCRKIGIEYSHTAKLKGIEVFWYKPTINTFDDKIDDPESMCYCNEDKMCLKRGLGNIKPCYYNLPVALSFPHFLLSDPSLVMALDGLNPVDKLHESRIAIQPKLGVPIKGYTRIQLNLLNGGTKFNNDVKKFDHLTLPILWIEAALEGLPPELDFIINLAFNILPVAQKVLIFLMLFAGISGMSWCLLKYLLFYYNIDKSLSESRVSVKYMVVFPYIKREIAKLEEKDRLHKSDTV